MLNLKKLSLALLVGLAATGTAGAAEVIVDADITVDTVWTADNTYNLDTQIYVKNGASLTIEAGTIVASTPTANGSGSLAVTRGSKIYVQGTADNPVIMTSTNDTATWTDGDPKTGTWRVAANEWGNLTIMGNALIGYSYPVTKPDPNDPESEIVIRQNTPEPDGLSVANMEGLTAAFDNDPNVQYGGNDDDDDSGSISYLSIRYGGRVVGLANELNGLSLGAIGRETEIHHVEIMNNVDDGIEIWGGTVELKYVSIWNIGDDSFDIDQGWRGKAQFGLIVQGYSLNASQGSGVGDNCFETDGAENAYAQPVTTAVIYNFTAIGNPGDGDGGTVWRDNARVQYRNCIFMDLGEKLVRFDNLDGDGAIGYQKSKTDATVEDGTLNWAQTWTTPYTYSYTQGNDFVNPISETLGKQLYQSQVDGNLAEITGSVFFNNFHGDAYTEADARGVTSAGASNAAKDNIVASDMTYANSPIQLITRDPDPWAGDSPIVAGGKSVYPVVKLNPCAANAAASLVTAQPAPADGFFTPAPYRGGFSPTNNWLKGWTAADAYGFLEYPAAQIQGDAGYVPTPEADGELTVVTTVSFEPEAGVIYSVEKSSDMTSWAPVQTVVYTQAEIDALEDGKAEFEIAGPLADQKFYRVIKQ